MEPSLPPGVLLPDVSDDIDEEEEDTYIPTLEDIFKAYCRMDATSRLQNVEHIPLSQSDAWMIAAKILDTSTLTTTDTGMQFIKFRRRAIDFNQYLQFLENIAQEKNLDFEELKDKLTEVGLPVNPLDKKPVRRVIQ